MTLCLHCEGRGVVRLPGGFKLVCGVCYGRGRVKV